MLSKKRLLPLLLALVFALLSCPGITLAGADPSDWAAREVGLAKQAGLVTAGVTSDYTADVTREQFCELVIVLYEAMTGKAAPQYANVFSDTENPAVAKANGLEIVFGVSATEFAPHRNISREELCVMLVRCIDKAAPDADVKTYNSNVFADIDVISDWALPFVQYAFDIGIIQGVGENKIDPKGTATCEQAIILAYRIHDRFGGAKPDNSGGGQQTEVTELPSSAAVGDVIRLGGIDWRVLEVTGGRALLLSDQVLEERRYHGSMSIITWELCSLREYLNGEFFEKTFSAAEKERIAGTIVHNGDNPWFVTYGGNSTVDRVFILDAAEVVRYFGDSGQLGNASFESYVSTIEDEFNSARIATGSGGFGLVWWLRSPGLRNELAATVRIDGVIDLSGVQVRASAGVRPAMWFNLQPGMPDPPDYSTPLQDKLPASVAAGDILSLSGVKWRVLEVTGGRALLISEYVLEMLKYSANSENAAWEQCDLRQYLNGAFYDRVFSDFVKSRIVGTLVSNDDNQWYDTPGGGNTTDKVFLLSIEEVVRYFGDSGQLANQQGMAQSISDVYSANRIATDASGQYPRHWWLRSPGEEAGRAACVNTYGNINISGESITWGSETYLEGNGVRPAFWIELQP